MLELDIQIKSEDLYDYLLRHTYHGTQGILGSCLGALAILIFIGNHQFIYLLAGVVLLAYIPWSLFLKSKQQAMNQVFKEPLHYVINEEGIFVTQGEANDGQKWDSMYKAVSTRKSIIVYTNPVNACIFPRRELGSETEALIELISTHMPPKKVHIKY